MPEEDESKEDIADRVFKVVFPAVNGLEIRGKFAVRLKKSKFQRIYRCSCNRSVLNNKTAPRSDECKCQIVVTVIGEVNKDPE